MAFAMTKPPKDPWKLQPPIQQPPIQQAINTGFSMAGHVSFPRNVSGLMLPSAPRCWLRRGRTGQNGCSDFFRALELKKKVQRQVVVVYFEFVFSNVRMPSVFFQVE